MTPLAGYAWDSCGPWEPRDDPGASPTDFIEWQTRKRQTALSAIQEAIGCFREDVEVEPLGIVAHPIDVAAVGGQVDGVNVRARETGQDPICRPGVFFVEVPRRG